jgi:hypothetical protein
MRRWQAFYLTTAFHEELEDREIRFSKPNFVSFSSFVPS